MALPNKRQSKRNKEKIDSPSLQKEARKSHRTFKIRNKLYDSSSGENSNDNYNRPLYKDGLTDDEIVDKNSSSSDDFESSRKKTNINRRNSKKTRKPFVTNSNSNSRKTEKLEKSEKLEKDEKKVSDKNNRRKLYSSIKENIEVTSVDAITDDDNDDDDDDDDDDEKTKQATLKFHNSISIHFKKLRKSLKKISSEIDNCEEQCLNGNFKTKNDALDITKRLENILKETETTTIESSKEINKTYQSWSRNYSSYFKLKNGYKRRKKVKNSSTNDDNDDNEKKSNTDDEPIEKKRILEITNNEVPSDCDSDEIFSGNDITQIRENENSSNKSKSSELNDNEQTINNSNSSFDENNKETKKKNSNKDSDFDDDLRKRREKLSNGKEKNKNDEEKLAKEKLLASSSSETKINTSDTESEKESKSDESASKNASKKCNKEMRETDSEKEEKQEELAKKKLLESSSDSENEETNLLNEEENNDESTEIGNKKKEKEKEKLLESSDSDSNSNSKKSKIENIKNTTKTSEAKAKEKLLESSDDSDGEKEENAKKKLLASSDDSDVETEKIDKTKNTEEKVKKKLLASSDDSEIEKSSKEKNSDERGKKNLSSSDNSEKVEIEKKSKISQDSQEKINEKLLDSSDDLNSMENISNDEETNSKEMSKKKKLNDSDTNSKENKLNQKKNDKEIIEETPSQKHQLEETAKKKLLESSNDSTSEKESSEEIVTQHDEVEAKKKLLYSSDSEKETEKTKEEKAKSKLLESSDNSLDDKEEEKEIEKEGKEDKNEKNLEENAKKKLLSSNSDLSSIDDSRVEDTMNFDGIGSNLSSSEDEKSHDLFSSLEVVETRKRKRSQSSDDNSESCRSRRKKTFKISKNTHYRNDEKLRLACYVKLERLSRRILKKYAKALQKSKRHLEQEKHKSLISMDNIEKTRKRNKLASTSSDNDDSESKSNRRNRKKANEKDDDTLMDHLKKVENGEVDKKQELMKSSEDESSNEMRIRVKSKQDLFNEAEKRAKDLLLCSSGSDAEMPPDVYDESEKEKEGNKDKKNKEKEKESKKKEKLEKDKSEKSNSDDSSIDEEEAKKKADKDKWKNDKLLRSKISDSDSEVEKAKYEKRKEKLEEKEKKDDSSSNEEKSKVVKKKKRVKRKILDSDSDIEIVSEYDSSSSSSKASKTKEDKKKSRKRGAKKSSDSDDSLEEKKPKTKRKRIKQVSDSDSDSEAVTNSQSSPIKGGRKNIRKVLKDKQVADDTKQAAKEEEERLKRIAERQKVYNEMYEIRLAGEEKVEKLILDFDEETKKELISVDPALVKRLKPHQAKGIKFMWDACFESVSQINNSKGSGCIIAHCMGLGKTFQVVTLVHTLLTNKDTGVNTVMVVCPLSTALNWASEFEMWLKDLSNYDDIEIIELGRYKQNFERKYQLEYWKKHGGVLIIGYDMFRTLTGTGKRMKKSMQTSFSQCLLDPGPDVIVCDEGHLLKNEDTALSKAMRRVKTLRRIVLTGTPLQNNLVEYHCMVQFVKPNLLGTKKEFSNRFVNPIKNGSTADSTPYDVKLMKKRAFILHNLLEGSVQRFDYSVLTPFLPPKQEYVISVKLSPLQIELYQYYLDNFTGGSARGPKLFANYHALQRICTHPIVMKMNAEKMEKKRLEEEDDSEGSLKDFIDDGSDSSESSSDNNDKDGSDVQCVDSDKDVPIARRGTRANPIDEPTTEAEPETIEPREWWSGKIKPEHFDDIRVSAKLVLLFGILKESEKLGDKILVFSQSLYSLTLIEEFLSRMDEAAQNNIESENLENHTGSWSLGLDYFRLDGQTSADNRAQWCKIFNRPTNTRARLFLISTRAGGLGINLTAANRVIIFDASWNPSHDVQSIFRIYRFGQKKPCYIYRFLSKGTMEEKIYNRQVSKLSLACRVIDEQQIERHFNSSDLAELYTFDPNPPKDSEILNLPKDRLLAEIFLKYKDLVHNYHEHDSLLENQLDEVLDEEERKLAWEEYENEKKGRPVVQFNPVNLFGLNPMNAMNTFHNQGNIISEVDSLANMLRKDYPNRSDEELRQLAQNNILNMYSSLVERQAMNRNPQQQNQYLPQSFAMQSYIQQQQYQYQQQQQIIRNMQRQQQLKQQQQVSKMTSSSRTPARHAVIDISSPNGQEE
ncbi:transcriptional regulator ATRX homolog isoform X2 [Leptopilina boulardi]|nr:transcriptional regulator ATRX homolog isoform X2 [Leptopilina boulardi]